MAPQTEIPVSANVLGCTSTILFCAYTECLVLTIPRLWCVQLIPQIWTNWRTKNTDGLPSTMMFLWAACGVPFGAYDIVQNFNIPLQVQPHVFMGFALISWAQTLVHSRKWPVWKAACLGSVVACVFAGIEAALILTLGPIYEAGNETPILVVGIVAAILLVLGLIPPYFEIAKRRGRVVGINWIFLSMDWSGAVFSLLALVVQNTFDVMGGIIYILCALLELGIFLSHVIWLWRTRKIRKEAAAEGKTFDDVLAAHEEKGTPFEFAQRKGRSKKSQDQKTDPETGLAVPGEKDADQGGTNSGSVTPPITGTTDYLRL